MFEMKMKLEKKIDIEKCRVLASIHLAKGTEEVLEKANTALDVFIVAIRKDIAEYCEEEIEEAKFLEEDREEDRDKDYLFDRD